MPTWVWDSKDILTYKWVIIKNSISKVRDIFINIQDLEDICDIGLIRMVFFYSKNQKSKSFISNGYNFNNINNNGND